MARSTASWTAVQGEVSKNTKKNGKGRELVPMNMFVSHARSLSCMGQHSVKDCEFLNIIASNISYKGCVHLMHNIMVYNVLSHNPVCFTRVFAVAYMSPVAADFIGIPTKGPGGHKETQNQQPTYVEHGTLYLAIHLEYVFTRHINIWPPKSLFQLTSQLMMQPSNNINKFLWFLYCSYRSLLTLSAMHGELICEIHIPCLGRHRLVRWESYELSFQDF